MSDVKETADTQAARVPASGERIGDVAVARFGHVALVTLDRPAKLNAMEARFWGDLRTTLDRLAADGATRVVVLTGAGDRAFSAGGDIQGFLDIEGEERILAYQRDAMDAFRHVERTPLVVIAAINGIAYGGGCELAMASDIVVAAECARFALPEAALGLVPGFGIIRAPQIIGIPMTRYLIASGDSIDADQAERCGLAQLVVPDHRLLDEAMALAERIAARSPSALAVAKRMVNGTLADGFEDSVREVSKLQSAPDRARGIEAFLARRSPVFGPRDER